MEQTSWYESWASKMVTPNPSPQRGEGLWWNGSHTVLAQTVPLGLKHNGRCIQGSESDCPVYT
ncbi:MAG: hypothetical protein RLZZ232_3133 [Planctomycetota bacterium]|jgi:hypothetical protein